MSARGSRDDEDLQWRILIALEEICGKLDRLISLSELGQRRELKGRIEEALGRSTIRREIYELCDGTRTVSNIATAVGKSIAHTSKEIVDMEKAGILGSKRIGKQKYYTKIL